MRTKKVPIAARATAAFLALSSIALTFLAVHPATATIGHVDRSRTAAVQAEPRQVIPSERPDPTRGRKELKRHARAARAKRQHSKKKAGPFAWPVRKNHITVGFGWRHRFELKDGLIVPIPGREFHHGIDIACAEGDPVRAARPGVVILSGMNPDYGNVIVIRHARGYSTLYGHMQSRFVATGRHVHRRQLIGLCGMTGRATGPHVHFEIRRNGSFFDPRRFLV